MERMPLYGIEDDSRYLRGQNSLPSVGEARMRDKRYSHVVHRPRPIFDTETQHLLAEN